MDFANLKAFYQVAVSGNFSKAADELFVSQPALSRQVAALEKELGLQLFIRQGRQVVLTDAGRRLLQYAEKIIGLSIEAKKEMLEYKDLTSGELTLGASTTIANYLLPKTLALFQKKNSGIIINLKVGNSSQVAEMTAEGMVDFGLIAGKSEFSRLYHEQFAEDDLNLVISSNHSYLKDIDTNLSDKLNQETFICREAGSDTQRLLDDLLVQLNIQPKKKIILGDTEAIKRGVINDMGVAFLSSYTFEYELQLGLLAPLKTVSIKRPLLLVYPKGSRLSPAALAFSALLKKNIR
jgi:DNA-binding transcriptional LysR family regulator